MKQLNRPYEAIAIYHKVIKLAPQVPLYHENLGIALTAIGNWPDAIREFEATLRLDPKSELAHTRLATIYLRHGNLGQALLHIQLASALNPKDKTYLQLWADILHKMGRFGEEAEKRKLLESTAQPKPQAQNKPMTNARKHDAVLAAA